MRGQRNFNELVKDSGMNTMQRKGRNNTLLTMRNESLLARYYYYGYIKNKCYEEILRILMTEFFISPVTIANLILERSDLVLQLKQKAPSMYYFQSRWPYFKW